MKFILHRLQGYLERSHEKRASALAALNAARRRTQFVDVQRRIRIYLRALWNCDFVVKQTSADPANLDQDRPFIENYVIHLPRTLHDRSLGGVRHVTAMDIYRAAAAHGAAHVMHAGSPFSSRSLDKWQIAVISAIEDARVEALSIRTFPGLRQLWAAQHTVTPQDDKTAGDYLNRLARALLDESYHDDDPWIVEARALFAAVDDLEDPQLAHDIGLRLAESFRAKRIKPVIRAGMPGVPYRDDNRFLWRRGPALEVINPYRKARVVAGGDEFNPTPGKKPPALPSDKDENEKPAEGTYFYPEWNYRSQSEDPFWVTLREKNSATSELKIVDDIVAQNGHLVARMQTLLHAIRDGGMQRIRKLEEGDEIDINAAIRAQLEIRMGMQPDARIMMRSLRKSRDISVLMLLDLSRSMNDPIAGREHTAMQLTQQVSVLFAEAIDAVGDPFAIHGFSSETRHNVEYFRLKDFGQSYDDVPKARLAGMAGLRGTRMGAAVRHATYHLNQQKSSRKLLLLMSDGEPSDVDVPDRQYLCDDTRKAVEDARRGGIHTYCISLDPGADQYVSRIFGAKNYMVVDHIRSLPEKILLLYAALTL